MLRSYICATCISCVLAIRLLGKLLITNCVTVMIGVWWQEPPKDDPAARLGSIASGLAGRIGSLGSMFGKNAAPAPPQPGMGTQRQGSMAPPRLGSQLVTPKKAAPPPKKAAPAPAAKKAGLAAKAPISSGTTTASRLAADSFWQTPGFDGRNRFVYREIPAWHLPDLCAFTFSHMPAPRGEKCNWPAEF